jgi:IMP dehydrogenase/GMP reductase
MAKSKLTQVGYELESIHIIQAPVSDIEHRAECDPMIDFYGKKAYPVIVSPMGAVTNEENYKVWLDNNFLCVVPRTVDYQTRIKISEETFASFSLAEARYLADHLDMKKDKRHFICIDIAHGTMQCLYSVCKNLKAIFGDNIVIMTGNVANPFAYAFYENYEIDFMRACVGTGSRCTTSCNVGVHYPTATLVDRLRMEKEDWDQSHDRKSRTNIIVDGGISNFDDIQKCIALGAWAVMSGSIFAKAQEACEPIVFLHPDNLNMADAIPAEEYAEKLAELKERSDLYWGTDDNEYWVAYRKLSQRKPYRLYYGMSTKLAQKKTGGKGDVTAEGIARPIPVEYPIAKWADNMASYMRSCMSYTGCRTIEEMRENTELIINLSGYTGWL